MLSVLWIVSLMIVHNPVKTLNLTRCSGETINGGDGILTSLGYPQEHRSKTNDSCCISAPADSITTIRILHIDADGCINVEAANDTRLNRTKLSICEPLQWKDPLRISSTRIGINFLAEKPVKGFALHYMVKHKSYCDETFPCISGGCFSGSCDGIVECLDSSDELGCGTCQRTHVKCPKSSRCFNIFEERCDGVSNCPDGKDEANCTFHHCGNSSDKSFRCSNEKCVSRALVGNGLDDCGDGSDENAHIYNYLGATFFLTVVSFLLLWCWCSSRRDIQRLIENPPDFPLPVFRAPGEGEGNLGENESEEVFQAFVNARSSSVSRRRPRGRTRAARSVSPLVKTDSNCSVVALASLGVAPEDCLELDFTCMEHRDEHSRVFSQRRSRSVDGRGDRNLETHRRPRSWSVFRNKVSDISLVTFSSSQSFSHDVNHTPSTSEIRSITRNSLTYNISKPLSFGRKTKVGDCPQIRSEIDRIIELTPTRECYNLFRDRNDVTVIDLENT